MHNLPIYLNNSATIYIDGVRPSIICVISKRKK